MLGRKFHPDYNNMVKWMKLYLFCRCCFSNHRQMIYDGIVFLSDSSKNKKTSKKWLLNSDIKGWCSVCVRRRYRTLIGLPNQFKAYFIILAKIIFHHCSRLYQDPYHRTAFFYAETRDCKNLHAADFGIYLGCWERIFSVTFP